jgi:hypothetical protein
MLGKEGAIVTDAKRYPLEGNEATRLKTSLAAKPPSHSSLKRI